ncbi:MAG: hypothetical protein ABIF09_17865 [Gemmatimonadota bacterium]
MGPQSSFFIVPLLVAGSCGWNAAGTTGCEPVGLARALPGILQESSGVALSSSQAGILFSHNDGGHQPSIFALNPEGAILGEIPLKGVRNWDWEDIATGECEAGACIYLADVGDNEEVRDGIVLYRVTDLGVYDGSPQGAEAFHMVLPDGPRDMEAVFILPDEEVFFVSKGRNHAVTLYRYPPPLRAGDTVTLESVQALTGGRLPLPRQVTGADASDDGSVVAIRSYESLSFFRPENGRLMPIQGGHVALRTLNEAQGEAVGLGPDGEVVLTSEAALGRGATMTVLKCRGVG